MEERISVILENCNQKIFGILHIPRKVKKAPLVLLCHGLAGNKSGKYRAYVDLAYRLSAQGIAAFRFDYRGCGDSEGFFHEVTPSAHYSDSAICLEHLKSHPNIDSSRMGIFGRSFGGPVAIRTATLIPNHLKAIALWCPMYSGEQWKPLWDHVCNTQMTEEEKIKLMQIDNQPIGRPFFEEFFKVNVTQDLLHLEKTPMLHIHGENDTRVDISHAQNYEACRNTSSALSEFIRLKKSDHDFSDIEERQFALNETVKWFVKTLTEDSHGNTDR